MAKKKVSLYSRLPKECKIFCEYILPSAILTAAIDYFGSLEIDNSYVLGLINLVLIFLRELKPRYKQLKK